jgi:hypothetical protein
MTKVTSFSSGKLGMGHGGEREMRETWGHEDKEMKKFLTG